MSDLNIDEQRQLNTVRAAIDTARPIANIIELTTNVIKRVAGKDIGDTLGETSVNRAVLSNLVAQRVKEIVMK